jgi:hypothetical protein
MLTAVLLAPFANVFWIGGEGTAQQLAIANTNRGLTETSSQITAKLSQTPHRTLGNFLCAIRSLGRGFRLPTFISARNPKHWNIHTTFFLISLAAPLAVFLTLVPAMVVI